MSDRYYEECKRREEWAGCVQTGEVDLLVPGHVADEVEREQAEHDEPGIHTGVYL